MMKFLFDKGQFDKVLCASILLHGSKGRMRVFSFDPSNTLVENHVDINLEKLSIEVSPKLLPDTVDEKKMIDTFKEMALYGFSHFDEPDEFLSKDGNSDSFDFCVDNVTQANIPSASNGKRVKLLIVRNLSENEVRVACLSDFNKLQNVIFKKKVNNKERISFRSLNQISDSLEEE